MHIRGFDGLRALAVLLVFLTHKTAWGASANVGFSGVWLFFLLSGFLIGGQLWTARAEVEARKSSVSQELGVFWLKRALRIFPAYYIVIAFAVPFYLVTSRHIPGLPYYLTYLSNFHFQRAPSDFLTTWAHFWSLAVEEQFYLLFAPLMLLVPLRHASRACVVVVLASLVQRFALAAWGVKPYVVYVDSLVNFGLLALGALLFIHRIAVVGRLRAMGGVGGTVGWWALPAVVLALPFTQGLAGLSLVLLQAIHLAVALVAAVLLMSVFAYQSSLLVRVLEWAPIAYAGRISYGLYLYNDYIKADLPERALHLIAQGGWFPGQSPAAIKTLMRGDSPPAVMVEVAGIITCLAVLFGVAHLSWIIIERPALRLRHKLATWLHTRCLSSDAVREQLDVASNPSAAIR